MRVSTDPLRVDEELFAAVMASTQHDDHGRDHFHQFVLRVNAYGTPEDVLTYQGLVMESHATYQSAIVYWDAESRSALGTSRAGGNPTKFAACMLYRALNAYSAIFIARPWRIEMAAAKERLIELDPELEGTLGL